MACVSSVVLKPSTHVALTSTPLTAQKQSPQRLVVVAARRHRKPGVHHRGPALEKSTFPEGYGVVPETAFQPSTAMQQVPAEEVKPAATVAMAEEDTPAWHDRMKGQLFWFMRTLGTIVD